MTGGREWYEETVGRDRVWFCKFSWEKAIGLFEVKKMGGREDDKGSQCLER